jgi:hypothetical protein
MPSPPDSAERADPRPRKFLIAAGTARYRFLPESRQLPSVESDLRRIVKLFVDKLGYERALLGLAENPESGYFSERLGQWLSAPERSSTDRIVLYYSGHGAVVMNEHFLMMTNSDDTNIAGSAVPTANLARMLARTQIRQMIVILDTCHAAAGGGDFLVIAKNYISSLRPRETISGGFWALAAARPSEEARQDVFSDAFVRAVDDPPSACGSQSEEYLSSYEHLVERINTEFHANGMLQRASVSSIGVESAPLFLPNPRYKAPKTSRKDKLPANSQTERPLEHRGKPSSASSTKTTGPIRLFYSYSHKDEVLRDELEEALALLNQQGLIAGWHDRRIGAGDEWKGAIDKNLEEAQIILLLVSASFIASKYCWDIEVKRAIGRHDGGQARVIPVILRPCDWQGAPFGKLQALPKDGKAATSWPNKDEAWTDVAKGIRRAVEAMTANPR